MEPSRRLGIARQGASVLVTSFIILVLNTATGTILARVLGPTGRGEWAAVLLWPTLIAAVGSLGVSEAVIYLTASMRGRERVVLGSALLTVLIQSTILSAAWFVASSFVLKHYGPETVHLAQYMVWTIPLALVSMVLSGALLGSLDIRAYNRVRLGGTALMTLGLVMLLGLRQTSLTAIVVVHLTVSVMVVSYSVILLSRIGGLGCRPDLKVAGQLLSYGIRSHVGTVSNVANERADQALISVALPAAYLGLYSVAVTLPGAVSSIGGSLAAIALPGVASTSAEPDKRLRLAQLVRATLFLSVLAAGALLPLAAPIIELFFGRAFLPAAPVAQVLLFASILFGVNRVISAGVRAFNRPFSAGAGDTLAAGVTVVSLALLVPTIGIMGAAVASLLAYSANLGYNLWICTRLGMSVRELLVPTSTDVSWLRRNLRRFSGAVWATLINR